MRFKYSFDFNISIGENINVKDTYIPPLLCQPFVENAVIHGLATKSGKGMVEIDF